MVTSLVVSGDGSLGEFAQRSVLRHRQPVVRGSDQLALHRASRRRRHGVGVVVAVDDVVSHDVRRRGSESASRPSQSDAQRGRATPEGQHQRLDHETRPPDSNGSRE